MEKAVVLALTASFCTATSSVCQRLGVRDAPGSDTFNLKLMVRLVARPMWLLGIASMILGFLFQVTALHYGSLALVQPILATELLIVFGYMALLGAHRVRRRDWLAAAAMAIGLGGFLFTANPSGGRLHAPGEAWWLAAAASLGAALLMIAFAYTPVRGAPPSPARRAGILGAATGLSWGFVAAVIKELSSRTSTGLSGLLGNWSPYVLLIAGAASLVLATHALQAGPLPASQPGFSIVDPLVASLLGVFLFGEHLQVSPGAVVVEVLALAILVGGVVALSHSQLVVGEPPSSVPPSSQSAS